MGVDLNLDEFNISTPSLCSSAGSVSAFAADAPDACASVASSFWSIVDEAKQTQLDEEDVELLKDVFHPKLSNRRSEGETFIPPDTSSEYVQRLRQLIKEERTTREHRKDHFFTSSLQPGSITGQTYPSSWSGALDCGEFATPEGAASLRLNLRDGKSATALFRNVLETVAPSFCKCTEDGATFRIYQHSGLQIRSVQELDCEEIVGAIFSIAPTQSACAPGKENVCPSDKISKVTEFVEGAFRRGKHYNYYLLIETQGEHAIVTETLEDGTTSWDEVSLKELATRNAKAKVTRTEDLCKAGLTVAAMKDMYLKRQTQA